MNYAIDTQALLKDFITYAKVNTRSDESAPMDQIPTTPGQTKLAQILAQQLRDLGGVSEIKLNPANGYLTALLPSNLTESVASIGFIAHLDTADYEADHVQPQIYNNYDGSDIHFKNGLALTTQQFPNLKHYLGQTLITTDGTTLLGVDDKAGIAAIIAAVRYLLAHPEVKHGPIKIAFGPDEEIGRGADRFDVADFASEFAYTLDNGLVGEIEYETFNAAQAVIDIQGTSVHPGDAKGQLVNAISIAEAIDQAVPQDQRAEDVAGYDGFYLLLSFKGNIDHAQLVYIVRDFDHTNFLKRKQQLIDIVANLNQTYAEPRVTMTMTDQYYNMADIIKKDPYPIDLAKTALRQLGIEPFIRPFRGGTDGSKITYKGMPTPNLFNGGENFHGPYEFVTLEALGKVAETVIEISKIHALQRHKS
ncbi:peptidase T [Agrilactobacillus composti DSM 18527 = JCM 14202]|uniref:Peptidase T n=1 Tax=Agrilactobacillus composti DSM 18527 = JCM 14202 TaxID=1423734 RepID=X0PPY9_9LACO|nr:peptidase T [Agrilactobacillus composti]KRM30773.1 peptidase T [Agrilactobacillus composti DSM 18527 = JCM 14202]GAF39762.1 tripeptide aminopeptidase [Agrilactobacillus composti DSM 18527 = JCM 14202]